MTRAIFIPLILAGAMMRSPRDVASAADALSDDSAATVNADSELKAAIERLASKQPGNFRSIAASFPEEQVITALDDRIRNDPAFAPGERARRFAFETLLLVSEHDELGYRLYTDPRQIQLFIDALYLKEPGPISDILRVIYAVDDQFIDKVVPAIESLFDAQHYSVGPIVFQTLGQIGSPAQSSLPLLKRALVDPQAVNPRMTLEQQEEEIEKYIESLPAKAWREEYRKFLENPSADAPWGLVTPEQSIIRFRSGAALARLRIDISLLSSDIALYQTLDPLGQQAGALALVGAAIKTKGQFDDTTSSSVAAAAFLADVYSREEARELRKETIPAIASVLTSEFLSDEARSAWQDSLLRLMVDSDEEFRRTAMPILQRMR